jgi:hypothetical protein
VSRIELVVPVDIDAPAATVWDVVTDWSAQGEWILGTRVTVQGTDGARRLGGRFVAFTGVGPVGFTDPMEVVEWDPPRRCVVAHLGRVVRGDGVFEVTELGPARSRFLWTERLELPLGALGRVGWPLVRPAFRLGVEQSLRRLGRICEARHRAESGGGSTADV